MSKAKKPIVSDPVQYVSAAGTTCAALVIGMVDDRTVNLAVFYDGLAYGAGPHQVMGISFSEEPTPYTWHWPERA